MAKIYLFSGLGADERVFQKLDFSSFQVSFVEWIEPEKAETIEQYAKRLTPQIKTENPILIGLSFGGMMAIEVAKWIPTQKVILIASAKTYSEIPFYFRILGKFRIYYFLPFAWFKKANILSYWFFGTQSKSDKQLLQAVFADTQVSFLQWAISQILTWKNTFIPNNLIHIHGTADRILPFWAINADLIIKNGGHLMTINKAEELNSKIRMILLDKE